MVSYWNAPLVWDDTPLEQKWVRPPGARIVFKNRPRDAGALEGGPADPWCVFEVEDGAPDPDGGILLGTSLDTALSQNLARNLASRLGLARNDLLGMTLAQALFTAGTFLADPTGLARAKPYLPNSRGILRVGGIGQRRFNRATDTFVLDVLKNDAVFIRDQDAPNRDPELYRKVLRWYEMKYGYSAGEIIPGVISIDRETTLSDDFNDTNQGLETHLSDQGDSWTVDHDWNIENNNAKADSDGWSYGRLEADLSGDDHENEVIADHDGGTLNSNAHLAGPATRYNSAANDAYFALAKEDSGGSDTTDLYEVSSGTRTELESTSNSYTTGLLLYIKSDGSDHTVEYDGTPVTNMNPFSDSTHSGYTRVGIFGFKPSGNSREPYLDDLLAADLGGGGGTTVRQGLHRIERGSAGLVPAAALGGDLH